MKRIIVALSLLASISVFVACSGSKKTATEDTSKKSIYGTWTLTNIALDGVTNDQFSVKILGDIPRECMMNSTWVFPYNGYGSYTSNLQGAGCPTQGQNILWSRITENGVSYLQFKELESGIKDKKITSGYRFEIVSQNAANMVVRNPINIAGKNTYIVYYFSKNQ